MALHTRFAAANRKSVSQGSMFSRLCGTLKRRRHWRCSRTLFVRRRPNARASAICALRVGPQGTREHGTRRGRKRCKTRFGTRCIRYNTTRPSIRTENSACRASRSRRICGSPRTASAARGLCSRAERVHTQGNRDTASSPSDSLGRDGANAVPDAIWKIVANIPQQTRRGTRSAGRSFRMDGKSTSVAASSSIQRETEDSTSTSHPHENFEFW